MGMPEELLSDTQWPSKQAVGRPRFWRYKGNPAVLVLNVKGDLVDVRKPDPLAKLRGQSDPPSGLLALIAALQKAAADDQVASVYLRIGGLATSMARVEELRDAIRKVRAVKPVVGFFESGAELEIALGASCTELHVSPGGYTMLSGFAQRSVLLRGMLKRLGLEPEVSQIGAWKGGHVLAGDPTDGVGEPEEVKIQSAKMLEAQRERYLAGVAEDSGSDAIVGLLKEGAMGDALSSSDLFTSIVYEDQLACSLLEKASSKSTDPKKKPALWLSLQTYNRVPASKLGLEAKQTAWYSLLVGGKKTPTVAVVPLTGQIFGGDGKSNSPRIFAEPAIAAIRAVAERKDVAAVVLRVDSPGGDALASELIWRAACLLGTTKPVVASMGSVAASGGYFIPMAAHRIFAQPSTITGSIGVISARFSPAELLEKHLRVWTDVITAGDDKFAAMSNAGHRLWTEAEWERMSNWTREIYSGFIEKV